MALNPFFLQGSQSEQRLVQDLLNEQMTIYGVEVTYIPRRILNKDNLFTEVEASKFSDNFSIEAYVNTYEGYSGAGDIMTKFGVSLKDELTVTISKERFEDYIGPFMASLPTGEIEVATRPQEGDLIYFPLGSRLFEITFVEHEKPFYQLGKNYVYQLQCELFEYEDEIIDTSIAEIDETVEDEGFIVPLSLFSGVGITAVATATTSTGYVRSVILNNDGYGYTEVPTVSISTSPTGNNASAVAITTSINNIYSVKEILLTNTGAGYTVSPTVTIVSTATTAISGITTYHGVGAAATASVVTDSAGIRAVGMSTGGTGYDSAPVITFNTPLSGVGTAIGRAIVGSGGTISNVYIVDAGIGYTTSSLTIAGSGSTGGGTYQFNEVVTGSASGITGRVKNWDLDTLVLKVGDPNGTFFEGENIVGEDSLASYTIDDVPGGESLDKYEQNSFIETEADSIIDFSESNPFGQV